MSLIAITGGIGAGKSVLSRMLAAMGYEVYDCDSRARDLIDGDHHIRRRIADEVCREAVGRDGRLDRRRLGTTVFGNPDALAALNAITHAAVRADLHHWAEGRETAFVETAIFNESGLARMVDGVWIVNAPETLRIERVVQRSGLTPDEVRSRIKSQSDPEPGNLPSVAFLNDGRHSLLRQLEEALKGLPQI